MSNITENGVDFPAPSTELTNLQLDPSLLSLIENLNSLKLSEIQVLKGKVETELSKNLELLSSEGTDLHSSLITPDGYPRSDIDVLQITMARRNVNMLRNDLHKIIERSHELLNQHFQKRPSPPPSQHSAQTNLNLDYKIPFAVFDEIVSGSPIQQAGVQNGDKLILIGDINAGNHNRLQNIQRVVLQSEDRRIPLKISRENDGILDLWLVPSRNWSGRSLLGCKVQQL
ncbi:Nas2p NDAI_0B01040 [Naumovozyma dairenensis CBS 421]|uniref:Probable 26S proteasome regulatory subunit p27 n=1 Tax=Naumovozyma dairenensis (strain ATCC 10597 / BCRC 20456 / CBS 421 / NBRC 0211 / NRRL Y-12639) TaxID=1071378 RepID=G0W5S7_NAUDC|nr:hypothetical protein NDAI_0B01040 [Naumovozyma dairenensis CBS 421]CCD23138.1 hypothetical protein NDAI_0B01040 [Naumovozyma dairenensis CBS 421]